MSNSCCFQLLKSNNLLFLNGSLGFGLKEQFEDVTLGYTLGFSTILFTFYTLNDWSWFLSEDKLIMVNNLIVSAIAQAQIVKIKSSVVGHLLSSLGLLIMAATNNYFHYSLIFQILAWLIVLRKNVSSLQFLRVTSCFCRLTVKNPTTLCLLNLFQPTNR